MQPRAKQLALLRQEKEEPRRNTRDYMLVQLSEPTTPSDQTRPDQTRPAQTTGDRLQAGPATGTGTPCRSAEPRVFGSWELIVCVYTGRRRQGLAKCLRPNTPARAPAPPTLPTDAAAAVRPTDSDNTPPANPPTTSLCNPQPRHYTQCFHGHCPWPPVDLSI